MVRACSSLAVALLVPSVALGAPATPDDTPHVAANVVIDLACAGCPRGSRRAEHTITHSSRASSETVAKKIAPCGSDRECQLRTYRGAGIDIVLFGSVTDTTTTGFQTWTPARLDATSTSPACVVAWSMRPATRFTSCSGTAGPRSSRTRSSRAGDREQIAADGYARWRSSCVARCSSCRSRSRC